YEAAAKAITGQAESVPLIITGVSGWTDVRYSKVAVQQLDAHVRSAGKVILATPAYIVDPGMKTNGDPECLHISIHGERHLGEHSRRREPAAHLRPERAEPGLHRPRHRERGRRARQPPRLRSDDVALRLQAVQLVRPVRRASALNEGAAAYFFAVVRLSGVFQK